jgi:hypothetical protein
VAEVQPDAEAERPLALGVEGGHAIDRGRGRLHRAPRHLGPVLQVAARHGCPAACLLAVSDLVLPERRRIDDEALTVAEERLGRVAGRALARG